MHACMMYIYLDMYSTRHIHVDCCVILEQCNKCIHVKLLQCQLVIYIRNFLAWHKVQCCGIYEHMQQIEGNLFQFPFSITQTHLKNSFEQRVFLMSVILKINVPFIPIS